uniref:Uncharacterized protein n=1 Tax=Timema tahoe TaxID=61484 RepID=A0A7R9IDZ9_9NEOP|nr:unnamed protein product [Timema tahoe]
MEGGTSVKIEPEEDLEYNLQQEEKFEIKSEIDLQIKSEEAFKEEFKDYHQPDSWTGPITFPPIKEELPSEVDLPIKSEEGFKEELNYYRQPECWPGPTEELPKIFLNANTTTLLHLMEQGEICSFKTLHKE